MDYHELILHHLHNIYHRRNTVVFQWATPVPGLLSDASHQIITLIYFALPVKNFCEPNASGLKL